MIHYGEDPADWVVRHGRPARCLGSTGMPSYEHEDGGLLVFDLLLMKGEIHSEAPFGGFAGAMLFSRMYGLVSVAAPDGMVPLQPGGVHQWRPAVYRMTWDGFWQQLGSQRELAWRYGLGELLYSQITGTDYEFTMADAEDRAEALLREHLTPHQQIELRVFERFRVRGAETGHTYFVGLGDGFERINPITEETIESFCLHPEEWIPECDVALATKFALEDAELEAETLEGARGTRVGARRWGTLAEHMAARLEAELV